MKKILSKGVEIYYGGDMANKPKFGVIINTDDDRFGSWVTVRWENGETDRYSIASFSPVYLGHGGTRFVTKKAYMNWREHSLPSACVAGIS